jgi:hypothetical protein
MKRLLIALLVLVNLSAMGQTLTGDRVVVRQSLYLKDWWVDSVGRDTSFAGKTRVVPTADAVYRMVSGRMGGGSTYTPTITTAAASTTLTAAYETWVFTGAAAATFTLPASGTRYVIKSRGTGTLTVSGTIYTTSATTSLTLYPGEASTLQWDGTYWIVY